MALKKGFNISNDYTEQTLISELETKFSLIKDQTMTNSLVFFDTFDWRLFEQSLLLYKSEHDLCLQRISDNEILFRQPFPIWPRFIWDFPESELKEYLEPIIEMRALLKLTEANLYTAFYRILNDDEKTVVRLTYETLETQDEDKAGVVVKKHLSLNPVRGYDKSAKMLERHLTAMGFEAGHNDFLVKLLAHGDRIPGDYSDKLNVKLKPQMRADEATKIILRSALEIMRMNEPGVKEDIDTEFLHDFRVAVRRTRSVLSQVKGVFSEETTHRYKREFNDIGKLTNELRDLDVYLLARDNFKAMLPETLSDDIDPLFDYLQQKRGTALKAVIDGLNSAKYTCTLQDWEAFLQETPSAKPVAANAAMPIISLAQNRIYKKYRRVVKQGKQILKNMEDEQLHNLRLECKKLRYLMEFFESLFPQKEIGALIKQVKKLQTNLGDFNDLCVQEEYLLNTTNELPLTGAEARKVFVAVGCLVGVIQQERMRVKANFAQTFKAFATPANTKKFKQLFAPESRVKPV